jgi:hypothetical protein
MIASAAFGSELAPQVQFLREFRDNKVMSTLAGTQFMRAFNAFYYSFSPSVAQLVAENSAARSVVQALVFPLIASLQTASFLFQLSPLSSEFAAILVGIVASSLIGTVYLAPIALLRTTVRKKHPGNTQPN